MKGFGGTLKKNIAIIIAIVILAGCAPAPTPAPTPTITPAPTATNTPEPTQTPESGIDQDDKDFLVTVLLDAFDNPDSLLKCNDATWVEDVIKFRCELTGFIDEPTDHAYLHWSFLQSFAMFVEAQPDMFKNTTIELVTSANRNGTEMLSSTSPATMDKIVTGMIATEVEWVREAEIIR
jgi:hypothetical protein